eukprot:scpid54196/ scgid27569/ 
MGFTVDLFLSTPISGRHLCLSCHRVLDDPVVCEKCSGSVCRGCCQRLRTHSQGTGETGEENEDDDEDEESEGGEGYLACPRCQAACSENTSTQQIAREISDLHVRCPQNERGCASTMPLHRLRHHVISECSHTLLHCPHDSCPEEALDRNNYELHVTAECEFRLVACAACGTRLVQRDLCTHQRERRCFDQLQRRRLVQNQQETAQELRTHRMKMLHERHATEQLERRLIKQHTESQQKKLKRSHSAPAVRLSLGNGLLGAMGTYRVGSAVPHFSKNVHSSTLSTPMAPRSVSTGGFSSIPHTRPMSCRRCSVRFVPTSNRGNSCQWHRGPMVNQFGGSCMNCGKWRTVDGCKTGSHMGKF